MELVPVPRRRVRRPSPMVLAAIVLFALAALVLAPQALGLRHQLVRDGAMGATWRGAVVLVDDEPGPDLAVGDVVTFVPPSRDRTGGSGGVAVVRRVAGLADDGATTRADAATVADPRRLPLDTTYPRVVARAPYVGRVLEGSATTWLAVAGVGVLAGTVGLLTVGPGGRRRARRRERREARATRPIGVG